MPRFLGGRPLSFFLLGFCFAIAAAAYAYVLALPFDDMASTIAPQHLFSRSLSRSQAFLQHLKPARLLSASAATAPPNNLSTSQSISNTRSFSSTPSKMAYDSLTFKQAIENRRTVYALQKKLPIPDSKVKEIVETAIKEVPSSFNSQSTRLVVLIKEEHDKFWAIVEEILKAHVPADKWEYTANRLAGFKGGYGTILFYEDPEPIKTLQSKFAQYADKFPTWSEHTSAMHQYALWTALEAEGVQCSLQHYSPLPDQKASETWGVPLEWSLKAQLVFGEAAPGARENLQPKAQQPIENRTFFHGF